MIDERTADRIFQTGLQVGVISTMRELGGYDDKLSEPQAHAIYGKKEIKAWRHKGWITGYPSGNQQRSRFYYLRSECEIAMRRMAFGNMVTPNKLKGTN